MTKTTKKTTKKAEKVTKIDNSFAKGTIKETKPLKNGENIITFKDTEDGILLEGRCRAGFFKHCTVYMLSIMDDEELVDIAKALIGIKLAGLDK